MAPRQQVVGIDGPETLEHALRSAFYLADDGLSTAAYLALARQHRSAWSHEIDLRPFTETF